MMRIHLRRIWADRRLLICLVVAFGIAILLAKPQILTIEQLRSMDLGDLQARFRLAELQSKEDIIRWYAAHVYLPEVIAGNSTAILIAAVLGSYIIGSCLTGPIIAEQYAGTPRTRMAVRLYAALCVGGLLFSLLLLGTVLFVYARECLQMLGSDVWRTLLPMLGWRVFFDVAAFGLVALFAFLTRELYISFCVGAILSTLTTMLKILRDELWWLPNYALRNMFLYQLSTSEQLSYVIPSLAMLMVTPVVGILILSRIELK